MEGVIFGLLVVVLGVSCLTFLVVKKLNNKLTGNPPQDFQDEIKTLYIKNKELQKIVDNKCMLPSLIFQTGDLIHYQFSDYKDKSPKNAEIYSLVGTILRSIGSKSYRQNFTVLDLIKDGSIPFLVQDHGVFIKKIHSFNSVMLVDLVSRIQGMNKDGALDEALGYIEYRDKIKNK